jgi:hypothetical protein
LTALISLLADPVPLGIGKDALQGRDPRLAVALAVLVGVAVFALLWKIRKTFGMRE